METKKENKKLCAHSINGGCHLGGACNAWHPAQADLAKSEQATKHTLNICGFHPNCAKAHDCSFLHVDLLPQAAPASVSAHRKAPAAKTPTKPIKPARKSGHEGRHEGRHDGRHEGRHDGRHEGRHDGRHEGRHDGRHEGRHDGRHSGKKQEARRSATGGEKKQDTLPAFGALGRIRGKVNAIHKAEMAFSTLAASLSGPAASAAQEKAKQAKGMLDSIAAILQEQAAQLDGYIELLGAKVPVDDAFDGAGTPESLEDDEELRESETESEALPEAESEKQD